MQREMPHLLLPVVLVHGIFMRDDSRVAWGRIPLWLSEGGNAVFFAGTDACAPVERNAMVLGGVIETVCAKQGVEAVHLVGFSRGGVDARYCAACSGLDARIASVTTVCTPHRGSFVARNGLDLLPDSAARAVSTVANWHAKALGDSQPEAYQVFRDLDPESATRFFDASDGLLDSPASYCQSFALASARSCRRCFLKPVCDEDLPNDGLVSVRSANWAHFRGAFFSVGSPVSDIRHEDMVDRRRKRMHLAICRPDGTTHDVGDLRDAWCLMMRDLKEAYA